MNRETRSKVSTSQASYLGIVGMDITSSISSSYGFPQGVVIRSVESGSPADNAGLSLYDIIVGFDDQTVSSMSGLQSIMEYYAAGETVTIEYYHPEGNQYV
jgi:serine protease Do